MIFSGIIEAAVRVIREADIDDLRGPRLVDVIMKHRAFTKPSMRTAQNFEELAEYLRLLSQQPSITTYLEIGVLDGATFLLTIEYLKRFFKLQTAVACDPRSMSVALQVYRRICPFQYLQMASTSEEFAKSIAAKHYDLCLIDGNHRYDIVRRDFNLVKSQCDLVVLHDTESFLGPKQLLLELQSKYKIERICAVNPKGFGIVHTKP